jgi:DNA invertase Pin-like site-specific DNA recombinase
MAYVARHGLTLDDSEKMEDKGIGGFTGEHRSNPDRHALACFLDKVKANLIPPDSTLIIENLDRLSREDIRPALTLFLLILDAKINIVQLSPETVFRHEKTDPLQIMMAIMELSRGHSESAMKSERVGRAWANKRTNASSKKLTARVPAWLVLSSDRKTFDVVPDAVAVVRRIFKMAIDGSGLSAITSTLNREKVPAIGRAPYWASSYVAKILSNKAVLGDYQPFTGRASKRKKTGDPVKDYYPAIIDENTFYLARAAAKVRRIETGPKVSEVRNLFTGILHDARDKCSLSYRGGSDASSPSLVSYKAIQGDGTYVGFPYAAFESAILKTLREVSASELRPDADRVDMVESLKAQRAEVAESLSKIQTAIEAGEDFGPLVAAGRNLAAKEKELIRLLDDAQQQASSRQAEILEELKSLLDLDQPERRKLRARIKSLVSEVWAVFSKDGSTSYAVVQMFFKSGAVRSIMVRHAVARGGNIPSADAFTQVIAATGEVVPGHDLRTSWDWVPGLLDRVFPPVCTIAIAIDALNEPLKDKLAIWNLKTGRSISEYYRQIKKAKARGYRAELNS